MCRLIYICTGFTACICPAFYAVILLINIFEIRNESIKTRRYSALCCEQIGNIHKAATHAALNKMLECQTYGRGRKSKTLLWNGLLSRGQYLALSKAWWSCRWCVCHSWSVNSTGRTRRMRRRCTETSEWLSLRWSGLLTLSSGRLSCVSPTRSAIPSSSTTPRGRITESRSAPVPS